MESGAVAVCSFASCPCQVCLSPVPICHLPRSPPQFSKHQKQHMVTYLFLIQRKTLIFNICNVLNYNILTFKKNFHVFIINTWVFNILTNTFKGHGTIIFSPLRLHCSSLHGHFYGLLLCKQGPCICAYMWLCTSLHVCVWSFNGTFWPFSPILLLSSSPANHQLSI